MHNFTTNQTRNFYVASKVATATDVASFDNLDIALGNTATGELFFKYKNADGLATRSDSFVPARITSLKKTAAADMARPLLAHTIKIDTDKVTLSDLVGKTLDCVVTIHGVFDYDDSNTISFTASVTGNSTNTASAAAFHKALAEALALAQPQYDKKYPFVNVFSSGALVTRAIAKAGTATGSADGVVLVEGLQKYVRGKLTGEPSSFSVAFRYAPNNYELIDWGTDTVAESTIDGYKEVPANYALADLEYFALGERGDQYRGAFWPNDVETTYVIDPFGSTAYDVLSVEFYWAGDAENVQKSPRLIQVAAPATVVSSLYDSISAKLPAAKSDVTTA